MARCLRARPAKMCGGIRTRAKVIQLDCRAFDATVHWNRQTVPAEEGFGDCQSVVVSYGAKCGFSGLLVAAEPGKMRTIAQKIGRLVLCMLFCVVAGGCWEHACLKSTSTWTEARFFARRQSAQTGTWYSTYFGDADCRCIFAVCRTAEETTTGAVEGNSDAGPTSGLMIMCLLTIYKLVCRQGGMERHWETCT